MDSQCHILVSMSSLTDRCLLCLLCLPPLREENNMEDNSAAIKREGML